MHPMRRQILTVKYVTSHKSKCSTVWKKHSALFIPVTVVWCVFFSLVGFSSRIFRPKSAAYTHLGKYFTINILHSLERAPKPVWKSHLRM